MLFLLRQIRRKLLAGNQVITYLLYGIGEIFLVVIGILIAVQIDNWNEGRKAEIAELSFYRNILEDLEKDSSKLAYYIHFQEKRIEYLDTLLTYVRDPTREMGREKFGKYIEPIYYSIELTYYATTFESAKSTGLYTNFSNQHILKELTQYYEDYAPLEKTFSSITRFVENHFEPIMYTVPESYMTKETGELVIHEQSVQSFYYKIAAIPDNRMIEYDYKMILTNQKLGNYIIGDLGRSYNALGKLVSQQSELERLKSTIHEILKN